MPKSNFTIKIDRKLLRDAKALAAQEDTSVNAMMVDLLEKKLQHHLNYEQAMRRALDRINNARPLNWQKPKSRDELYDR